MDIELTSTRDDGTWTWRAAGAREPKGTVEHDLLPEGAKVGDVLRAELDAFLDGMQVISVQPPKQAKPGPELLELVGGSSDRPLVTTTRVKRQGGGPKRKGGGPGRRGRDGGERRRDRSRGERRPADEATRGGKPPEGAGPDEPRKPKPKRLKAGRTHRNALLESLKAEERPIAEQVLQGGIPAVRQAIKKQNEELKAAGKPEVNADNLLQVAEKLRARVLTAAWRDRADAALKNIEKLDLRDLRSVVNAAGDAGRDQEAREIAEKLRTALADRVEAEQAAWVAEVTECLDQERVVRALRLSSRPPKAGSPLPGDLTQRLVDATTAALTAETNQHRWATVLDALAYSPIRRRVVPTSLPPNLTKDLRDTIAKLATRLPEIAHIFDIAPEQAPARPRPGKSAKKRAPKKAATKVKESATDSAQDKGDPPQKAGESQNEAGNAEDAKGAEDAEGAEPEASTDQDASTAAGEGSTESAADNGSGPSVLAGR